MPGVTQPFAENAKERSKAEQMLLHIALLCNDSHVNEEGQEIGDPTETALLHFGKKLNESPQQLRDKFQRELELPFASDRK